MLNANQGPGRLDSEAAAHARGWHHARQAAVCDVLEPWAHGTVLRASRYPSYYDFNLVRVEDDPHMTAEAIRLSPMRRRRGARVLAAQGEGPPLAFAQLEHEGAAAEITEVYVHPDHRSRGLGTALTRAAIKAAGSVRDLWIVADDEDRPKELYARLGFRPVSWTMEFTLPG
jgi:ribosomal protein S18 acetylase RimI-like enzyme